jgi:hypothetical protein
MNTCDQTNEIYIDLPQIPTTPHRSDDEEYPQLSYEHFIQHVIQRVLKIPKQYVNIVLEEISERALSSRLPKPNTFTDKKIN